MKYCSQCGNPAPDDAAFCSTCGSAFPLDAAVQTSTSSEETTSGYAGEGSYAQTSPSAEGSAANQQVDSDYLSSPSAQQTPPPPTGGAYTPSSQIPVQGIEQTVFTNADRSSANPQQNTVGLVGFIISLCAIGVSFIPALGVISWLVWLAGLIVSLVGIFSNPKGFAIAGLVISLVWIVIIIAACSALFGMAGAMYGSLLSY